MIDSGLVESGGTASGKAILIPVSQVGIGLLFSVDDPIGQTPSAYVKANATDDTKIALGIVVTIVNDDNIVYQVIGSAPYAKAVLVKGAQYYLDTIDGGVTSIEPADFVQPLFVATEVDEIYINIDSMYVFSASAIQLNYTDLLDEKRAEQSVVDYGGSNGNVSIPVTYSNIKITLAGNTNITEFTDLPAIDKRTIVVLTVVQGVGAYTIDWAGSQVIPPLGDTNAELQPNTVTGSETQYWMYWNGQSFTITMIHLGSKL